MDEEDRFYVRYYIGHKGKFGHEFLEFEVKKDGLLRYANHTNYKSEKIIKKEVYCNKIVLEELKKIIDSSKVLNADDDKWPEPDKVGRQELEIVSGNEHISFVTTKIGSLLDTKDSQDPEGMANFYYLVQDLKALVFAVMDMHFKIKPI
eukprot:TRINITY_DN5390_c5_g4_i1.p1 TRINITY_DN5390_c5_g4~~TRINITY_DN5390_c5_g4_i1.p1  ORF type:complete len:174 (+),score=49.55 TRINITY_DN5390_c5_g4_i1:76-522(+)